MSRLTLVCLLGVALAGCAVAPPVSSPLAPALSAQEVLLLQQWATWRATGRLAVKSAREGFNANFDWHQSDDRVELRVEGPFGVGRSRIWVDPGRIRVEAGGGPAVDFFPPFEGVDAVLIDRIGFAVPLHSIGFWLRGVPDPTAASEQVADGGFTQSGWNVYTQEAVAQSAIAALLPRKITLIRGEVRVRVLIDRWVGDGA